MPGVNTDLLMQMIIDNFESIFISEEYNIKVMFNAIPKSFPGIYYEHMMIGEFDLGLGGISGGEEKATEFMDVFRDDNKSGFTLNWGIDTTSATIPVIYTDEFGVEHFEYWSYNAIESALNGSIYLDNGVEDALTTDYELLSIETAFEAFEEYELPTQGIAGSYINWTVKSGNAVINDGVVTFGNDYSDFVVIMEAEIFNQNSSVFKEFEINVSSIEIVDDFSLFTAMTNDVYDIADGEKLALSGVVSLVDEDLILLTDDFGNGIYVVYLEANKDLLGYRMDFVGILNTASENNNLRYVDNEGYYSDVNDYVGFINPTALSNFDLNNLSYDDYYTYYSYTGFRVLDYVDNMVYLSANDETTTSVYMAYLNDDDVNWFKASFPIDSVLPETFFAILFEYGVDPEFSYHLVGLTIPESEQYIDDYFYVITSTFDYLNNNGQFYNYISLEETEYWIGYMQSELQAANPSEPLSVIINDFEVILDGLKNIDGLYDYQRPIVQLTYEGIDFELVEDPNTSSMMWTEVMGTELLIDRIMSNLLAGVDYFEITLSDGSAYRQNLNIYLYIDTDLLYNFEDMLEESIYSVSNNVFMGYYIGYEALDIRLDLFGMSEDENFENIYFFFHELMQGVNEYQYYLETPISHVTYQGTDYYYTSDFSDWASSEQETLGDAIYNMLYQAWEIQQEPVYDFMITIEDWNGVKFRIVTL
jgi:hypothetical protein